MNLEHHVEKFYLYTFLYFVCGWLCSRLLGVANWNLSRLNTISGLLFCLKSFHTNQTTKFSLVLNISPFYFCLSVRSHSIFFSLSFVLQHRYCLVALTERLLLTSCQLNQHNTSENWIYTHCNKRLINWKKKKISEKRIKTIFYRNFVFIFESIFLTNSIEKENKP